MNKNKYVRTFESFRDKDYKVNEEFLGGLFNKLKNKISLGYSKMFGSSAKVDSLIEEYKKEVIRLQGVKKESLKSYSEYIKSGAEDENKKKELQDNLKKSRENFEKQLELAKQKFDIKFKEVVDDEKNPKIQSYINLKKIEMQQELLATETKSILTDSGLSEEEAKKDEYLQSILTDIQTKMTTSEKLAGEEKKKLDAKVEEKTDDKKDGESVEYKDGDKIKYNMKDGGENQGEIIGIEGDIVKIKTDKSPEIKINKTQITGKV